MLQVAFYAKRVWELVALVLAAFYMQFGLRFALVHVLLRANVWYVGEHVAFVQAAFHLQCCLRILTHLRV